MADLAASTLAPAFHRNLVSWLNLIRTWFSVLTSRALTNASFRSVTELGDRIDTWVENWNHHPEPFVWARTAEEIIAKVARGRATLDRITTSGTTPPTAAI